MKSVCRVAFLLIIGWFSLAPLYAEKISGESAMDGKRAYQEGYLDFRGNTSLSRKEIAVMLDKLLDRMDQRSLNLSKSEIQEVAQLAKSFKNYLMEYETHRNRWNEDYKLMGDEHRSLHHDVSQLTDEVKMLKKEKEETHLYMIIGIISAAALGIIIK